MHQTILGEEILLKSPREPIAIPERFNAQLAYQLRRFIH